MHLHTCVHALTPDASTPSSVHPCAPVPHVTPIPGANGLLAGPHFRLGELETVIFRISMLPLGNIHPLQAGRQVAVCGLGVDTHPLSPTTGQIFLVFGLLCCLFKPTRLSLTIPTHQQSAPLTGFDPWIWHCHRW